MTVVQRLLDVAYPNMEAFRKKKEVVADKIVASVFKILVDSLPNRHSTYGSLLKIVVKERS